jgi:hypothetical protein
MRANAPLIRSAMPPRPVIRQSSRRTTHDTRAFFYCVLAGLMLASYVHDPDGVESVARQARTSFQQVTSHLTPAGFQSFLSGLANS